MEERTKAGAKEVFFSLSALATLVIVVGALLSLLFSVINYLFPSAVSFAISPSISLQVAALIVVTPIFLSLSWLEYRNRAKVGKDSTIRKWITALILFVTGAIVTGDLVTVLFYYIDGRDLGISFLLKAASIFIVVGATFTYYLLDIRNLCGSREQKIAAGILMAVVAASVILGFSIIGSPQTQRLIRYDEQKINDLNSIQYRVTTYYQQKDELPKTISDLKDPLVYGSFPEDPQGKPYEYYKESELEFVLCAEFNRPSRQSGNYYKDISAPRGTVHGDAWRHDAGYYCFKRTIDPDFFPPRNPQPIPPVAE